MSTSPSPRHRADDELITVLSRWLARHLSDEELRRELAAADLVELSSEQQEAVEELLDELDRADSRGDLEMVVRETIEALALG
jgi:hypothetical protein